MRSLTPTSPPWVTGLCYLVTRGPSGRARCRGRVDTTVCTSGAVERTRGTHLRPRCSVCLPGAPFRPGEYLRPLPKDRHRFVDVFTRSLHLGVSSSLFRRDLLARGGETSGPGPLPLDGPTTDHPSGSPVDDTRRSTLTPTLGDLSRFLTSSPSPRSASTLVLGTRRVYKGEP